MTEKDKKDRDKVVSLQHYRQADAEDDTLFGHETEFFSDDLEALLNSMDNQSLSDLEHFAGDRAYDLIKYLAFDEDCQHQTWLASKPMGWVNLEERPYLSQKFELAMLYKQNGLYEKALHHLLEIHQYDEGDHLGTRYEILALYVLKSDFTMAEAFYESKDYHRGDLLMEVPLMVGALLAGREELADDILVNLAETVPDFVAIVRQKAFPIDDILAAGALESYEPNSLSSIYLAFFNILPLLMTAQYYLQHYVQEFFEGAEGELTFLEELDLPLSKVNLFNQYGIHTLEDFSAWTTQELLDIPGVGKQMIARLKRLGVIFSQE
ncbi:TPA: DNA-binding protein [Streptococcus equi subsp. zooepidemicus]|uniref:DNA-binding protein n=1 Tax=Streptococcus equi TaxID=1336 RepID=UPI000DA3B8B6|nr:DNA-binding protein [Streptococcus equi]VED86094.1 DNA-binding protein [Streptococcus equi subsp. equi]MCD3401466.1 DNA-binding protein [Streptococcus equi subsp. zooepidemicus]MCD3412752.1 DNA-binding protein [Streptococcus equi subsp. zooepidemicus]MCD3432080.1 DNA-binding protein [Streptococcus equi subsp. zooepidemicus]MDI5916377.1 DNA-binding protein [Streptococcus equi subsp. zooepidemicus]